MEKEEYIISDNTRNTLAKNDLFERIKRNCRSKTKKSLLIGLVNLFLVLTLLIAIYAYGQTQHSVILVMILAIDGFICLNEYLSNKKVTNFDAPDEFIRWYDNNSAKILRNCFVFLGLALIGGFIYYLIRESDIKNFGLLPFILILVALIVMFIYVLSMNIFNEDKDIKHLRKLLNN